MKLHWIFATWMAAFREAWGKRTAFWVDLLVMAINDTVWLVVFSVLFRTGKINGWNTQQMFTFFATMTTIWGVVIGLFANIRFLGKLAADGELDAALTIPVDTLAYLLVRKIRPTNLGDILFGTILFAFVGHPSPRHIALFLLAVLLGSVVFGSFLILLGASALRFGGGNAQSQAGFDAVTSFSMYPTDFFSGATKLLLFTLLPTAYIGTMPVRLISDFSWTQAALLSAIAIAFAITARLAFSAGLRHYRSGSSWTTA